MAKQLTHTHQINVQTDEETVTVQIGGDGGVPGGFAKLFNRVVDCGAWGRLSDAARAAYIPLVRFADHRNQFRIQVGQAALMKYSGLSRSSIKRAVKDLLNSRLLALVEQGGVNAEGHNESNVYQLMVPAEGKPEIVAGGKMDAREPVASAVRPGSSCHPRGVQSRTPSPVMAEPSPRPAPNRPPVPAPTRPGVRSPDTGGSAGGPQYRRTDQELSIKTAPRAGPRVADLVETPADPVADAAVLLGENGVEPTVARQLAAAYPRERIVDVVATMEWRRARGKCDNPGGFIREALVKQWQTPRAVTDARKQAEARARQQAVDETARQARRAEQTTADADEQRVDRVVAALDDEELAILAASVLAKYDGNTAVLQVLTRKPPRECRLMKMEVARMLEGNR